MVVAVAAVIGIGLFLMRGRLGSFVVKGLGGVKAQASASARENVLQGERAEIEAKGAGAKVDRNGSIGKDPAPD